jgi:hypothetical protein
MKHRIIAALLLVATAARADAADRDKIRNVNIALQPVMTIASAAVQGKLRGNVLRCLLSGAVAGYGFYEAKVNAGRGDVRTAWAIANAASSISGNAAAGRHPLSRIRWTVGPVRADVATPFDRSGDTPLRLTFSAWEAGALVAMYNKSDRLKWRDGLLAFENDVRYRAEGEFWAGYTIGVFPGVVRRAPEAIWQHEVVHAIQALQLDSVEPSLSVFTKRFTKQLGFVTIDAEAGAFPVVHAVAQSKQPYENRWSEIEAYRLAEDISPLPPEP